MKGKSIVAVIASALALCAPSALAQPVPASAVPLFLQARSCTIHQPVLSHLAGSMKTARAFFTATLLDNGEVVAAGGLGGNSGPVLSSAELYNPATGKWTSTGSLNDARWNHTATLLNSGDVLIVGLGANTELYNPSRGTFALAAGLNTPRTDHRTVLLNNGDVLTTGGYDGNGGNIGYLSSAELFH